MASEAEEALAFQTVLLARRTSRDWRKNHWAGLDALEDKGMASRHIAHMLDVSLAELRDWRRRKSGWFSDVMKVAQALAVLDFLEHHGHKDPVAWLETPLLAGTGVIPLELYPQDLGMLLGLASGRLPYGEALDKYDPGWRTRPPSEWEVFKNCDGTFSIGRADAAGT
jgi:hypothetical protein